MIFEEHLFVTVKDQARAQAELLRRQEELEEKAAELDRRERELQSHGIAGQSVSQFTSRSLLSLTYCLELCLNLVEWPL